MYLCTCIPLDYKYFSFKQTDNMYHLMVNVSSKMLLVSLRHCFLECFHFCTSKTQREEEGFWCRFPNFCSSAALILELSQYFHYPYTG